MATLAPPTGIKPDAGTHETGPHRITAGEIVVLFFAGAAITLISLVIYSTTG